MKKFIIKNGLLIDKEAGYIQSRLDIACNDGLIEEIAENIQKEGYEVIDADGHYISAGMIDIHMHNCYMNEDLILDSADHLGVYRGVTTLIECGTVCLEKMDEFALKVKDTKTRYYTLLSGHGEDGWGKKGSQDPEKLHLEHFVEVYNKYPDLIKGMKIACSNTHTNDAGYGLVKKSKEICNVLKLPVTVHVGNFPPDPCGLVEFLDAGDVITHSYHGKEVSLFKNDGTPKASFVRARKRGVLFDVGHGSASFSWTVYDKAYRKGFAPDIISTDIRKVNIDGPVHSLAVVMSKMYNLGMSLEDCVSKVTRIPAKTYHLDGLGKLEVGAKADFTIFEVKDVNMELVDCYHQYQPIHKLIEANCTIVSKDSESILYTCHEGKI